MAHIASPGPSAAAGSSTPASRLSEHQNCDPSRVATAPTRRPRTLSEAGHEVRAVAPRRARRSRRVVDAGAIVAQGRRGRRDVPIALRDRRHRRGAARRRADRHPAAGDRAGRHRAARWRRIWRRPGRVPAAGHLRQLRDGAGRARGRQPRRRGLGRDRHACRTWRASTASARCSVTHPRGAPADRRLSGAHGRARRSR